MINSLSKTQETFAALDNCIKQVQGRNNLHISAGCALLLSIQQRHAQSIGCCITSCVSIGLMVITFPVVTVWLRAVKVCLDFYASQDVWQHPDQLEPNPYWGFEAACNL